MTGRQILFSKKSFLFGLLALFCVRSFCLSKYSTTELFYSYLKNDPDLKNYMLELEKAKLEYDGTAIEKGRDLDAFPGGIGMNAVTAVRRRSRQLLPVGGAGEKIAVFHHLILAVRKFEDLGMGIVVLVVEIRQKTIIIIYVGGACQDDLLEFVDARNGASAFPRLLERGHQHGRQNGDDGDHHQKLDQGELSL